MNYSDMHFKPLKYGQGTRGTVSVDFDSEVALKEFNTNTPPLESTGRMLEKIKNLNLHNIYKIYGIIQKDKYSLKNLHGYYMKYYKPVGLLLFQPIEYVIKNIIDLNDTLLELYKNNIETIDLHGDNVIVAEEGIIIIDVDNYSFINPLTKRFFHKPENAVKTIIESIIFNEILGSFKELSATELYYYMDASNPNFIENIRPYKNLYEYLLDKYKEYQESKKVM